ncbi:mitochondrial glycyl-tRNA synthetase (GlyRS) [Andalucia godoyi]|uniref:glycine--tRNA ligase n=1 Tax=Andalucia godoyi TaxID=505711 RepID=A0A8K0AH67_ANDGO|nr:mitochondrial glycyl-tRNA synthetase (GlyRS) [Andalucia godoyi]|eukprot:ANDGO_04416.mRNA.1 mitochondrial glycyl-tRNA synthetase (GlyRS)
MMMMMMMMMECRKRGLAMNRVFWRSFSTRDIPDLQNKVIALCKRRGFAFLDSEIYGGLANTYDFGPVGVELRRKIRDRWWRDFIRTRTNCFGIETPIMMHPQVWKTAGHVDNFADELSECKVCHQRFRADKLDERSCVNRKKCEFTDPKKFNMLFETSMGPVADSASKVYMRPETAQGIFVNYPTLSQVSRSKLPFGVGQIGRAFRNEISPGQFLFRLREFEQMELEFFCSPAEVDKWFTYWRSYCMDWLRTLGIKQQNLKFVDHGPGEAAHYAASASDIEYRYPGGWGELWGIANRTDYDLKNHANLSGKRFVSENEQTPFCVEPSVGLERLMFAMLCDAYDEEKVFPISKNAAAEPTTGSEASSAEAGDVRTVLRLHPAIAPFTAAVFPLLKRPQLVEVAEKVYLHIQSLFGVDYDEGGSIGKRYRRHDEIGTPYCITVDFDTLHDRAVTIRDRDTLDQIRVPIDRIASFLVERLSEADRGWTAKSAGGSAPETLQ